MRAEQRGKIPSLDTSFDAAQEIGLQMSLCSNRCEFTVSFEMVLPAGQAKKNAFMDQDATDSS